MFRLITLALLTQFSPSEVVFNLNECNPFLYEFRELEWSQLQLDQQL